MKKGIFGYCAVVGVIVIGCAAFFIGRAVRKNNKTDDNGLVEVEEAFDVGNILSKEYDNMDIFPSLSVKKVDSVYSAVLKIPDLTEYNRSIAIDFFKDAMEQLQYTGEYDESNVIDDNTYPRGLYYVCDDPEIYVSTGCTGFFCVQTEGIQDYNIVEDIDLDLPYEDKSYELKSGTVKISEAVELAEQAADKYSSMLGYEGLDLRAQHVKICEETDGSTYIMVRLQRYFEDVGIVNINDKYNRSEREYIAAQGANCLIKGPDEEDVVQFINTDGLLMEKSKSEESRIISVSKAADLVNEKLSAFRRYTLRGINLRYMMFYGGNTQAEEMEEMSEEEKENVFMHESVGWTYFVSYNYFTVEPVWEFCFETKTDNEIVAYVNCKTGDVSFVYNQ